MGTFLQDQIIYSVHFMDADNRIVGCRENELISADAPWVPSRFEVRDKVITRLGLSVQGNTLVPPGDQGEVIKVLRDAPTGIFYHVRFSQRIFEVPETALIDAHGEA
jgi:nitrogen fixation protein NifZ